MNIHNFIVTLLTIFSLISCSTINTKNNQNSKEETKNKQHWEELFEITKNFKSIEVISISVWSNSIYSAIECGEKIKSNLVSSGLEKNRIYTEASTYEIGIKNGIWFDSRYASTEETYKKPGFASFLITGTHKEDNSIFSQKRIIQEFKLLEICEKP